MPDAGANFEKLLQSVFVKLGYTMTKEGLWVKIDSLTQKVLYSISQYMDDLQSIAIHGDINRAEAELKQHLDCQPAAPLKRVVAIDYEVGKDFIRATNKNYAQSLQPQ